MHSFEVHSNESACRKSGRLGLEQVIDAITDFYIHPSLVYVFVEVILVNEILRNVSELDFYILGIVEWCHEVVVTDVVGDEICVFAGEYTIDHEFAKIKGGCFSSGIYDIDDLVFHDGDVCSIGILFLWAELGYNFHEGDMFVAVVWDICKA